jgi:hypothetical protein
MDNTSLANDSLADHTIDTWGPSEVVGIGNNANTPSGVNHWIAAA